MRAYSTVNSLFTAFSFNIKVRNIITNGVMTSATCKLVCLKWLPQELRFGGLQMSPICDNQIAIHIDSNLVFHERTEVTEHIEIYLILLD
jgi:hypothetical protein